MVKKFLKSLGLFLLIANLALLIAVPAYAGTAYAQEDVVGQLIREVGEKTALPSYESAGHAGASYEEGATGITSAILMATDALKYLMGTIAVIVLIVSGIRLITSTRQVEEVATKQKENIKYAIIGLIIISLADFAVKNIFFGEAGEVFRSESEAQLAAERGQELFRGMYRMGQYLIGAIAVFMLVINGIRLVVTGGNEDQLIEIFKEIQQGDYVISHHRSHYHYLLIGGSKENLKHKIMTGYSMYVFDKELKFMSTAIVSGMTSIATGIALALKIKGSQNKVWCFVGDGAEDEGHFYEAVRYVDGHDLPCTFIIEDNDRSVDTPKSERYKNSEMVWPSCVKRYYYNPTYPHVGIGRWVDFSGLKAGGTSF